MTKAMAAVTTMNAKQLIILLEAMRAIDEYRSHAGIGGHWARQGAGKELVKPLIVTKLICPKTLKYCGVITLTSLGLKTARETFAYTYRDMPTVGKTTYQNARGEAVLVTEETL